VYRVFAPYSPSQTLSPPLLFHWYYPPTPRGKAYSILLFSNFVNGKKWHFCLFKICTQGISLWHFHEYMYYNWIGSSLLIFFSLL
jgi:hypothetical protein